MTIENAKQTCVGVIIKAMALIGTIGVGLATVGMLDTQRLVATNGRARTAQKLPGVLIDMIPDDSQIPADLISFMRELRRSRRIGWGEIIASLEKILGDLQQCGFHRSIVRAHSSNSQLALSHILIHAQPQDLADLLDFSSIC
ncbi:MAG: hypothetical protein OEU92_24080 [Alphaproteobacteria bacterium]|nr:hypothetical protein [Alphaproteobacteria bacterium]